MHSPPLPQVLRVSTGQEKAVKRVGGDHHTLLEDGGTQVSLKREEEGKSAKGIFPKI
jgi:hypothetical protein